MAGAPVQTEDVRQALADFNDPETGRSVVRMEQVRDIQVSDSSVTVQLGLTSWTGPIREAVRQDCLTHLRERLPAEVAVEVEIVEHERPAERIGQIGLAAKSVVAVGSGKGGVGKSTVAVSLAYALRNSGAKVGLMDADVYGPSVPHLVGANQRPHVIEKRLQPIVKDDLKIMSMGFLVAEGEAVVWRGPMLHGAITQFLRDTEWGDLDYLIIDMPPGTGDIALTLSQLLPLSGAVVVCTPQDVALLDAVKAVAMFHKVNIPMLGVVENMSYFLCPDNGKRYDIFGSGGARDKAIELGVPFLGEVPINIAIRERGDAGETSSNLTDEETSRYFQTIAAQMIHSIIGNRTDQPSSSLPVL
ncbi:Mrp/NBP35 family ATP-binding protein [Aeoliella sp. ICT_H6.2]|uniref:Iron-sulfur cluster carrier protein n=1 Tax=Aeoliella straminimaris TaxID=2954799 RepID=A0A9X2FJ80_9BACT|nr:Mrp/NBP35 family ATP-binding protein [Aeoliella straminimaris]MCO6046816.1 Mrp/NBP35 family ATP-binding protein [Aeoliella straminimaris]